MTAAPLRSAASLIALVGAVGAAGCHRHGYADRGGFRDRPLQVSASLDCPDRAGGLRRADTGGDGRSCRYTGPDGEEVTLAYLALGGRAPDEALKATEADLRTLVPAAATPEPGSLRAPGDGSAKVDISASVSDDDDDRDEDKRDAASVASGTPTPPKPPEPPQIDRDWSASRHGGHRDHVRVNLPFIHIEAGDDGAHVRAFGTEVNANDDGATVRGPWGTNINAHNGGAEMRFGEVGRERADLTYIIASDSPGPSGYRAAAYVAKGPVNGPLVLATSRSREKGDGAHDEAIHDLKRLVNLNVRTR